MRSLNRVQLFGNLTRDPELRYTQNNVAIAKAGIAINRSYKNAAGEWKDVATFVDITFWNKLAEKFAQLHKGDRVFIEGRLDIDEWKTDKGESKKKMFVTGLDFFATPTGGQSEEEAEADGEKIATEVDEGIKSQEKAEKPVAPKETTKDEVPEDEDEEIPF